MPPLASAAFTPTPLAGRMHSASMLFGALCLSALMLSCSGGPFPSYSNSRAFCFYACACSCAGFCFDFRRIRAYPRRPTSSSTRWATRRRALAPCGCCPRSIPAAAAAQQQQQQPRLWPPLVRSRRRGVGSSCRGRGAVAASAASGAMDAERAAAAVGSCATDVELYTCTCTVPISCVQKSRARRTFLTQG